MVVLTRMMASPRLAANSSGGPKRREWWFAAATPARTSRGIIEMSTNPVVFSHSNPLAMWDQPRNIPDDLIRLCAQSGGVVGINGVDIFLGPDGSPINTLVKHVKYVVDLVGIEHVGIALDYSFDSTELEDFFVANRETFPSDAYGDTLDYVEPEAMPAISDELSRSGFARQEIDKVMGLNWLRVAERFGFDGGGAS